jgi:predicted enzyme related to lactoylglutathione lyase
MIASLLLKGNLFYFAAAMSCCGKQSISCYKSNTYNFIQLLASSRGDYLKQEIMKRVKGLGGVFFKCQDPEKMKEWYKKHLDIESGQYGGQFEWRKAESDDGFPGYTAWGPFSADTQYFAPSEKPFMFNYRVDDLEALLKVLREEGVQVLDGMEDLEYGKFAWIMDPEGNKIELWEPNDEVYQKLGEQLNQETNKMS